MGCITNSGCPLRRTCVDLQEAAGVGGQHYLRPGAEDVGHFSLHQAVGHGRLSEVVSAGRAAAEAAFRQFEQPQAGNLRQQPPRSGRDPLVILPFALLGLCALRPCGGYAFIHLVQHEGWCKEYCFR